LVKVLLHLQILHAQQVLKHTKTLFRALTYLDGNRTPPINMSISRTNQTSVFPKEVIKNESILNGQTFITEA